MLCIHCKITAQTLILNVSSYSFTDDLNINCDEELDFGLSFVTIRAFLLPEDQQMELEYLTETGQFNSTELNQMKVRQACFLTMGNITT